MQSFVKLLASLFLPAALLACLATVQADEFSAARTLLESRGLEVADEDLGPAALELMARRVDSGSVLYTAEAWNERAEERAGRFFHSGLQISVSNGSCFAAGLLPGTAADREIPDGARLLDINGLPLDGLRAGKVEALLRNRAETQLVIRLERVVPDAEAESAEEADDPEVPAATLDVQHRQLPSLAEERFLPGNLVYVRLYGLFKADGESVQRAMARSAGSSPAGMLLDLRGAGGDDLESAARIAGLFHPAGERIFTLDNLAAGTQVQFFGAAETGPTYPLVVLVDGSTEGASELLAAVLRALPARIRAAGDVTKGDPLTREPAEVDGGHVLYVSARTFTLRDGTVLDGQAGLGPDLALAEEADSAFLFEPDPSREVHHRELADKGPGRLLRAWSKGDYALTSGLFILLGEGALDPADRLDDEDSDD